ncbi:hypothetical protein CTEN210_07426 [Chaetoceros tenuissimus]|uniref:Protein FRA10AC1 n=1 Tax=Chaetoceros tenuissimus TaxID=426638 RepID=A0AAD3CTU3_9STRA|nr:hypothetical protein CTEN210_07426 [Chaetoceros tenuissimus]
MSRVKNITTPSDMEELKKAYQFVLDEDEGEKNEGEKNEGGHETSKESKSASTWQERMVQNYHSHLYKTHVIADLTYYQKGRIGLRWRTKAEVQNGKGSNTCANKHCSCYFDEMNRKKPIEDVIQWKENVDESKLLYKYEREVEESSEVSDVLEQRRLKSLPHGIGLCDYEVHFKYKEQGEDKEELVNLKLCMRCAPKIFVGKRNNPFIAARMARIEYNKNTDEQEIYEERKRKAREDCTEKSSKRR